MKSFVLENGYLLRLDKNEEVASAIADFCNSEKIKFASLSGIGAASRVRLGVFDTKTKKYVEREFSGDLEIVSLSGNVTYVDGKPRTHTHCVIAGSDLKAHGGHLLSAEISVTCEIVLVISDTEITRKTDPSSGLMLID